MVDYLETPAEQPDDLEENPLYFEGLEHMNTGRWYQALESFQALNGIYPGNPEVKKLIDEAQMRVVLMRLKPKQRARSSKKRKYRGWLVATILAVVIAGAGYVAYALWLSPAVREEMRIQRITQFRSTADEAVAVGNFSEARQALEQLLALLPGDPDAVASLTQLEQVEEKETLYAEAKTQIDNGNWAEARKILTELKEMDPEYRDVARLQESIPALKTLDDQFKAGEKAFAAGNWQEAIDQYQALQQADLTFRFEEVRARLYESHLALGRAVLVEDGKNSEAVSEAIHQFSEALKLDPIDYKAQQERELAEMYLTALNSDDTDEVIELLEVIYSENPDYAGTTAVELFYATLLERGDSSLVVNDTEAAIADYRAAVRLPVEDTSLAQEKLIELAESTSP